MITKENIIVAAGLITGLFLSFTLIIGIAILTGYFSIQTK